MSFIGNVPAEAYSPVAKDTFSGNGSTTDFTLSIPATTNSVEVFVENVQQEPTDAYTISGTTLSFTAAPVSGTDNIYVIHRGPAVQQVVPPAGVALNPSTVTSTGDISTEGDLKVEVASGGIYTITGTDTSSNRTLTLPDEAGTVLTSASDLTGVTGVPANFISYAIIADQKSNTTDGGTFTSGAFRTRDLNTEISDPDGIVSISSNKFSLDAGTYLCRWSAPAFKVGNHQARLFNDTDTGLVETGSCERCDSGDSTQTRSFGSARFTIAGTKEFIIQHECSTTRSTNGFGVATDVGTEVYTIVEIFKEA